MNQLVDADHLVVGAGAMGMAFVDALVDHSDARVALIDRRHGPGGHWLRAYPFVRLHQASSFYGVASTVLGDGRLQEHGPERGMAERATQAEVCAYYARRLDELVASGRVEFFPSCEHLGGRAFVSRVSGQRFEVPDSCRVVDARYLSPSIPAEMPPPFAVAADAHVRSANDLVGLDEAPSRFVVVGSGKTATDACIWLLGQGVDPDAICWIRPREPWLLNRAAVQPDPAVFTATSADIMQAAAVSTSLEEMFLGLEEVGVLLRIDPALRPTMARVPTLATWELEQLRTIEDVVRRGHLLDVEKGRLGFADGSVRRVEDDALVVHCAADGLKNPPLLPIWQPDVITLQPVRAGFPCFGAALAGYVEATRADDAVKNRLCPPSGYGNSMADWARMVLLGARASQSFMSEPDISDWSNRVAINPSRVPPQHPGSPALDRARERLAAHAGAGLERLAAYVG